MFILSMVNVTRLENMHFMLHMSCMFNLMSLCCMVVLYNIHVYVNIPFLVCCKLYYIKNKQTRHSVIALQKYYVILK